MQCQRRTVGATKALAVGLAKPLCMDCPCKSSWRHLCLAFALRTPLLSCHGSLLRQRQVKHTASSVVPVLLVCAGGDSPSDACTMCPRGTYSANKGTERCLRCPLGYTSPEGSSSVDDCHPIDVCPAGTGAHHLSSNSPSHQPGGYGAPIAGCAQQLTLFAVTAATRQPPCTSAWRRC